MKVAYPKNFCKKLMSIKNIEVELTDKLIPKKL